MIRIGAIGALACLALVGPLAGQHMSTAQLLALPQPAPDTIISYGADSLQFGELFRARSVRHAPVVVLIHGGCWLAEYNRKHIRSLAAAIAARGITVWSLEYRRVGNPGAGWPGSFQDIADGVDYVRRLARPFDLDTGRVVVAGHSAGGHFALWAGSRSRLPKGTPGAANPLRPRAILALAGVADLAEVANAEKPLCGDAVARLIGGTTAAYPDRYRFASPINQLPLGVEQVLLSGDGDGIVPPDLSRAYAARATKAGDHVSLVIVPDAGHFEVVTPGTPAGRQVIAILERLTR